MLGGVGNDWEGVVDEFAVALSAKTIPNTGVLLATDFSTSTKCEVVAGQITVMDLLQVRQTVRHHP